MAYTLTIDRSPLSLADLVLPRVVSGVEELALDKETAFSPGQSIWRKTLAEPSPDVAGRVLTQAVPESMTVSGAVNCNAEAHNAVYLQSLIAEVILALTQFDKTTFTWQTASGFFEPFTMTYTHDTAVYQWTCTEPADTEIGNPSGTIADDAMAALFQRVAFSIVRDPLPLAGPV